MTKSEPSQANLPEDIERILESKKAVPLEIDDATREEICRFLRERYAAYRAVVDDHFAPVKGCFPFYGPMKAVVSLLRGPSVRVLFNQFEPANEMLFDFPAPGEPFFLEEVFDRDRGRWVLQELSSYGLLDVGRAKLVGERQAWSDAWDLTQAVSSREELRLVVVSILELFGVREIPDLGAPPGGAAPRFVAGHDGTSHAVAFALRQPELLDPDVDMVLEDHALDIPSLSSRFKPVGRWAVELKTQERPSVEAIERFARHVETHGYDKGILATTSFVTWPAEHAAKQHERISLWDANALGDFILGRRVLREALLKPVLLGAEPRLRKLPASMRLPSEGDRLIQRLKSLPPGRQFYAEYQRLCVEILEFLFADSFRRFAVRDQVRTAGGHEVRDAIIPNRPQREFWNRILQEFHANNILFEFKNLKDSVRKGHVEQLRTYMSNNVKRIGRFGILVSRRPASGSACTARLKAYDSPPECLIIMVDDKLVENMIRGKEQADDPESVLEDLKEAFELSF
jgi:hypothetical protein